MLLNNNNNKKSLFIVPYLSLAVHCGCQETNWWAQIIQQYPHTYVLQRQNPIYGIMQEESIYTFRLFNSSVLKKHDCYQLQGQKFCSFNHIGHFGPPVDLCSQKRSIHRLRGAHIQSKNAYVIHSMLRRIVYVHYNPRTGFVGHRELHMKTTSYIILQRKKWRATL